MHDITDPFFSVVVRGLQDAAVADGLVVLVGNDDRDAGKLEGYLTMLLSQKPTGVVLIGGQLRDPAATLPVAQAVQRLREQGVPVVAVGRYELDIPHVAVDDVAAADCAVSHLVSLGHRHVAFLGGPLNSTTVQDRYTGYGSALMRVGSPLDERLVDPDSAYARGRLPGDRSAGRGRHAFHGHLRGRRRGRLRGDLGAAGARPPHTGRRQRGGLRRCRHVGPQRSAAHHDPCAGQGARTRGVASAEGRRERRRGIAASIVPFELVVRGSTAPPRRAAKGETVTIAGAAGAPPPPR